MFPAMSDMSGDARVSADSGRPAAADVQGGREGYEPPRLRVIGTLAELTRGTNPTTTDGLGPGSAL